MHSKLITIVIPVYREEKNLPNLLARLNSVTSSIIDTDWEYIFVNDGSPDNSINVLKQLATQQKNIKIIDFSRNFGKEIALTAGVHAANADAVICMDADLQHPPEVIPKLIEAWRQGAEVVATIRTSIEKQPLLRRLGSHLYYWLMARISGLDMASQTTDFRLFDRKVVEAFRHVTERERMFRGIMDWMGFKKVYVEFQAAAREHGCRFQWLAAVVDAFLKLCVGPEELYAVGHRRGFQYLSHRNRAYGHRPGCALHRHHPYRSNQSTSLCGAGANQF